MPSISMRQLLEAGVHFGHQTRRWNPKMAPYIFGQRNNTHIIDLEQTVPMLYQALGFVRETVADLPGLEFRELMSAAPDQLRVETGPAGLSLSARGVRRSQLLRELADRYGFALVEWDDRDPRVDVELDDVLGSLPGVNRTDLEGDTHGGLVETSQLLALHGDWVDPEHKHLPRQTVSTWLESNGEAPRGSAEAGVTLRANVAALALALAAAWLRWRAAVAAVKRERR